MKIRDLIGIAEHTMRTSDQRFGQALSNALFDEDRATYDKIAQDDRCFDIDPFYVDGNITNFIGWLIEQGWEY